MKRNSMMKAIGLSALLLLTGCSSSVNLTDLTGTNGKEWDAVWVEGTTITPAEDTPYLGFKDKSVWGYSGCNRLSGQFDLNKDEIDLSKMGSTLMACPDDKYETIFMAGLAKAKHIRLSQNSMSLQDENGKLLMRFTLRQLTAERLAGKWILKACAGVSLENVATGEKPFLSFDMDEQQLSGYTGCNRIFGPFDAKKLVEGKIDFTRLASTRMLCNDNGLERAFMDNLNKTAAITIIGGELIFNGKDGEELMKFSRLE